MSMHHEISKIAHEIWVKSGHTHGRDIEHWLEAEKIITQHHAVQRKTPPKSFPEKSGQKKTR
ncbi:MAG: hypothetical protein A2077_01700 [Nitrospirae bacterium GWC2_46_6]|nr:MAG: hypothetical protein A2077_01700 [Nitrospirae bacterium GWC2_46_6]OGW19840.1 MAG: hypothetical protein A2Z82_00530 [Nitrospirae bacterium GWA2_46_11]OGW24758.1 MAG: hypothetical protein A2X55_07030 [Nitrospirae bacterium GWB2_47_37]